MRTHPLLWLPRPSNRFRYSQTEKKKILNWAQLTQDTKLVLKKKTWGLTIWGIYLLLSRFDVLLDGKLNKQRRKFFSHHLADLRDTVIRHPAFLKGLPAAAFILGEGKSFLQDWLDAIESSMCKTQYGFAMKTPIPTLEDVTDVDLSLSHGNLSLLNCLRLLQHEFKHRRLKEFENVISDFYHNFLQSTEARSNERLLTTNSKLKVLSHSSSFCVAQMIHSIRQGQKYESKAFTQIHDAITFYSRGNYGLHSGTSLVAYLTYRLSFLDGGDHLKPLAQQLMFEAEQNCYSYQKIYSQADSILEKPISVQLVRKVYDKEINEDWDFIAGLYTSKKFFESFGFEP